MLTETSITLYNKYKDLTGKELYKKTIIKKDSKNTGATWQGQKVATISSAETSKGIMNMADSINIRIPFNNNFEGKSYIEPKTWFKLLDADRDKYFTIQVGDRVVKGECTFEFVPTTSPITNLDKSYDNVVNIMSVKVNDFGSKPMQHYAIGGK